MEIAGKTFIVTGAGSGLGAATTRALVGAGGRVIIADIGIKGGKAIEAELGPEATRFVPTDVTDEASVLRAVQLAQHFFGSLDGAVNCAGVAPGERVLGRNGPHSLETFARTLAINLTGTFNVIKLAAEAMQHNQPGPSGERGVIVNTASVAAFDGQIGQAAYAASKGGVVSMTLPIARELARFGIRVMTIAPGTFETPMVAGMPADVRASLAQQVPFPSRLGRPDEYAALVRHIIENQMLNGEVIRLDGAIRLAPR